MDFSCWCDLFENICRGTRTLARNPTESNPLPFVNGHCSYAYEGEHHIHTFDTPSALL